MADRLGSLEGLIDELAGSVSQPSTKRSVMMTTVKTTAELQAAIDAGTDPKTIQVAAAETVDTEKVRAEAAEAERQRCIGIQSLAAPGFEQEVAAALANGDSVEATGLTLFKAAQDRGISLTGMQQDSTEAPPATPPKGGKEAEDEQQAVSAISRRWQTK